MRMRPHKNVKPKHMARKIDFVYFIDFGVEEFL